MKNRLRRALGFVILTGIMFTALGFATGDWTWSSKIALGILVVGPLFWYAAGLLVE